MTIRQPIAPSFSRALLGGLCLLLLAACGIDQGGNTNPPPGASSSTLLLSGPIDGFGSVILNDAVLASAATPVVVGGSPAIQADLRLGQVVRAIARREGDTLTALFIEFQKNLSGNVDSIELATGSLEALGQTILTSAATRFDLPGVATLADLQVGDGILVSGIPTPDGKIFATYIGARGAGPLELTALVTGVNAPALTFELGALTVDYSQATVLLDLVGGTPQLGSIVQVTGGALGNGVLAADQVQQLRRLPGLFSPDATDISAGEQLVVGTDSLAARRDASFVGFVTVPGLPTAIAVDGIDVRLDAATVVVNGDINDLQTGQRIRVEGQIVEVGRVQAAVITIL